MKSTMSSFALFTLSSTKCNTVVGKIISCPHSASIHSENLCKANHIPIHNQSVVLTASKIDPLRNSIKTSTKQ